MSLRQCVDVARGTVRDAALAWLVVLNVACSGQTDPAHSRVLAVGSQVEAAIAGGDPQRAKRLASGLVDDLEARSSWRERDRIAARRLLVGARIAAGEGVDGTALEVARADVDTIRRLDGANSLELAASLHSLGDIYYQRGEVFEAAPLHERGVAIRTSTLPPDDERIAASLERLARTEIRLERYESARANVAGAIRIREAHRQDEPLALTRALELAGWLERYAGDYPAARGFAERARRRGGSTSAPTSISQLEGDLQMLEGKLGLARDTWMRERDRLAHQLGDDHPAVVPLERRLAFAADASGQREEALRHLDRGLRIAERYLAPCDAERMGLYDYAASSLIFEGDFVGARQRYERVLTDCRRCLGDAHSNTATVMLNLASLAAVMGDLAEAERLDGAAIQAWANLKPDHPYVARGLDALAEVVELGGDIARARSLYERALTIRREISAEHPDVAWTLTNLARVTAASGASSKGLALVEQAIDIYRRVGAADNPDHLARALVLRGRLLTQRADYKGARASLGDALSARERFFGATHPLSAETRADLARANWGLGANALALRLALEAEETARAHLKFTARHLPDRHALEYAASRPRGLDLALSIAVSDARVDLVPVFESVIRSRGVVLDELGARSKTLDQPDAALATLNATLATRRERLANLTLRSLGRESSEAVASLLLEARREKEDAERQLAERSSAFRAELDRGDLELNDIRRALPANSALVSFIRYERSTVQQGAGARARGADASPGGQTTAAYISLILRADQRQPVAISLGPADTIESAVAEWRTALVPRDARGEIGPQLRVRGNQLRQLVWDPIRAAISGAQRVLIVPDGALSLVPFVALPLDEQRYILDEGPLVHHLSAERDLVDVGNRSRPRGSGLLAIGGPDYSQISTGSSRSVAANRLRSTPCNGIDKLRFSALPGSTAEAETVLGMWRRSTNSQSVDRLLSGREASEDAFKLLGPGRRTLHVATHGFFLTDDCNSAIPGVRAVGGLSSTSDVLPRPPGGGLTRTNPLLRSGLALAGANRRDGRDDRSDGILTAEEVTGLNLNGVEWAVLSACETGLGEIRVGEGVLGLRRAFHVAGVRTVIMSLWPVEDVSTRQWMEALYRARLETGLDTPNSLRRASLELIAQRRARGQTSHPFYWGGFIASGDWN